MEWVPMKWVIIIGAFIVICLYFAPFIVANDHAKRNKLYILILNLALGWTVIGWVVALIWANRKDKPGEEGTKWKWLADDDVDEKDDANWKPAEINLGSIESTGEQAGSPPAQNPSQTCRSCGVLNPESGRFCTSCGSALSRQMSIRSTGEQVGSPLAQNPSQTCRSCGVLNSESGRFCTSCGSALSRQ